MNDYRELPEYLQREIESEIARLRRRNRAELARGFVLALAVTVATGLLVLLALAISGTFA